MANPSLVSSLWHNGKTLYNVLSGRITPPKYENMRYNLSNAKMGLYTGEQTISPPKSILFNEFVERNANTIRKKRDFVNTPDSLLGDHKIPLSKISNFYGIENGKFKVAPLDKFSDNTVIAPVRNKNILIDSVSYHPERVIQNEEESDKEQRLFYYQRRALEKKFKEEHPESLTQGYRKGIKYAAPDSLKKYYPNSVKQLDELHSMISNENKPVIEYFYKGKPIKDKDSGSIIEKGKFLLHSPVTNNSTFYSLNDDKVRAQEIKKYITENKVAQPILVDNGRYRGYVYKSTLNTSGQFGLYQKGDFMRKKQATFYTK